MKLVDQTYDSFYILPGDNTLHVYNEKNNLMKYTMGIICALTSQVNVNIRWYNFLKKMLC